MGNCGAVAFPVITSLVTAADLKKSSVSSTTSLGGLGVAETGTSFCLNSEISNSGLFGDVGGETSWNPN